MKLQFELPEGLARKACPGVETNVEGQAGHDWMEHGDDRVA